MKMREKIFKNGFLQQCFTAFMVAVSLALVMSAVSVYAQDATVLPDTPSSYQDCEAYFKNNITIQKDLMSDARDFILGCAIKTGRVRMFMIPYFIVYLIDVLVKLAATLCVLFIVIGGFQYAIGGISDEKEKAKKTILNALLGLVVTSMAWIVINVIQVAITSGGA